MKLNLNTNQKGFSLLELLLVVLIIGIISAVSITRLYKTSSEVGGAERLLDESAARVIERRAEAIRLNDEDRRMSVIKNVPPLPMNFADLSTTASLITEGDENGDCVDDVTSENVTCLVAGTNSSWSVVRRQDALVLPADWRIAASNSDLQGIPLIAGGDSGRGVLATEIGYDGSGHAYAKQSGVWANKPSGSTSGGWFQTSPFWAVYFIGSRGSGSPVSAVALGIHPSGLVEKWRYNGTSWIGYKNRTF